MLHPQAASTGEYCAAYISIAKARSFTPLLVKRLENFSNSDDWETFVAVVEDEIVGFIGVVKGIAYNIEGYYSQIMALAVSEKTRHHGIGSALVKRAEEWSLSYGITDIAVNSSMRRLDAHAFYEDLGYTKKSFSFKKTIGDAICKCEPNRK